MATHSRLAILESGRLPAAREPLNFGQMFRSFLKFSLAVSAVGSAAYGGYQALQQQEIRRAKVEPRREEASGPKRTFFQALIEADRAALKSHTEIGAIGAGNAWKGFDFGGASVPVRGSDDGESARKSLRSFFNSAGGAGAVSPETGWMSAYLSAGVLKRKAPELEPVTPTVSPQPANASLPGASRPVETRPAPQQRVAANTPAAPVPAAPKPQPAFAEVRRQAPVPAMDAAPKQAASAFTEVHGGGAPAVKRPSEDDLDYANAIVSAADKDVTLLQRARTVVAELAKRYPQAHETSQVQGRYKRVQDKHAQNVAERSSLKPDTPIAPVLFGDMALQNLQACLAGIPDVEKVAAVNRPVSIQPEKLAFLVAVTVRIPKAGPQQESRDSLLDKAQSRIAPALGPCFAPLFEVGTVSLAITDGTDEDWARQRIENTAGAVVYQRGL